MSWVSYSKLQTLCQALRNKFTTGEMVIANDDKSIGAHLNHTAQDGLVTISPITEDGVTPAALWVTDSAANNATELTGGTLTYVTDNGKETEDYTSLSLVGGVVNVSGKSGAQRRITNVADPVDDNDAVNKKSIEGLPKWNTESLEVSVDSSVSGTSSLSAHSVATYTGVTFTGNFKKGLHIFIIRETYKSGSGSDGYHEILMAYKNSSGVAFWLPTLFMRYWHTSAGSYRTYQALGYLDEDVTSLSLEHQTYTASSMSGSSSNFTLVNDIWIGA